MTRRIMSVDDSSSVRQLVAMTLTNAGYAVVTAEDGQRPLRPRPSAERARRGLNNESVFRLGRKTL